METVEWLPHPQNVAGVRIGPDVMGPVDPVVQHGLYVDVLDTDLLPAEVAQVSHPVVLDGVDGVLAHTSLSDLDADALVEAQRQTVGNPEVVALVDNLSHRDSFL